MKKIGVVVKPDHPECDEVTKNLVDWLRQHKKDVALIDLRKARRIPPVDMIVVLGGDGTLLSLARRVEGRDVPILAVNLGSLGFLTEVKYDEIYPTLDRVFRGQFLEDTRQMLACVVRRGQKTHPQPVVLNEVTVNSGPSAKLIRMEITIDHQFVTALRATGVIISTATGSTAYALSAGGPILYPSVEALVITPISPHMLSQRPIVVPSSAHVHVSLKTTERGAVATFDGQQVTPLMPDDVVEVRSAKTRLKLIRSPHRNYYQVLREKLRWGEG